MRGLLVALLLLAPVGAARAESAEARARSHFEFGLGLFRLGKYGEALKEFTVGYAISPRRQFLIDIAQCHRKLGDPASARAMLARYLDEAPRNDPQRAEVAAVVAELDRQLASRAPPPVVAAPPVAAPAPPTPQASPPSVVASPPPVEEHAGRRVAIGLGVAGVVVAAGVAVGIVLGVEASDPCAGASAGCFDLRR